MAPANQKTSKTVSFLHTANVHVQTFNAVFGELDAEVTLKHAVHPEWLEEARREGLTAELSSRVSSLLLEQAATSQAVICTCSTLGPIAEALSRADQTIIRIDAPMMKQAAAHGGRILVAIAVESTRTPTLALLSTALHEHEGQFSLEPTAEGVECCDAWPRFESGDTQAFQRAIADRIRETASAGDDRPAPSCAVLAQVSMACAGDLLTDLPFPVYASPRLAAEAALIVARSELTD